MTNKCSDCGCDEFKLCQYDDEIERNGLWITVKLECSECLNCKERSVFIEQILHNDEIIKKAWKELDNDK